MKEAEQRITRRGLATAAAGGVGALMLLASGKQAQAYTYVPPASDTVRYLLDKDGNLINPATEDTLALIKTNTANIGTPLKAADLTFTKELGRVALIIAAGGGVIDPRDRNWTITETVPVSSTTLATATGQSTTQPRNISQIAGTALTGRDWSLDFSNLASIKTNTDLLSTGATVTPKALSTWAISDTNLDAKVSTLAKETGGNLASILTQLNKMTFDASSFLQTNEKARGWNLGASDVPDVSDRAGRLLGVVYGSQSQQLKQTATNFNLASELITGATLYDARQIRTLTSTDVMDVFDRAARLLGIVYGSQSQQLKQTATNFNLATELITGATLYDARQIRTLTPADAATVTQGGAAAQSSRWPTFISDGTAERIGQKTMANSLPVAIASDQSAVSVNQTQATAGFQQPRKLVTYNANFRLASRPYAISKLFTAGSRFQFATIHHPNTATKTVKLRHVWVAVESASAAGIIMVELVRITAAPATGNPAITPAPANPGDTAAEATCLALPTTAGTEGALQSFTEYNLGITAAGSTLNPPPDLVWRDLCTGAGGFDIDNESKAQTIRASTLEGFAVTLDVNAAITVKGYVIMEFTEE